MGTDGGPMGEWATYAAGLALCCVVVGLLAWSLLRKPKPKPTLPVVPVLKPVAKCGKCNHLFYISTTSCAMMDIPGDCPLWDPNWQRLINQPNTTST